MAPMVRRSLTFVALIGRRTTVPPERKDTEKRFAEARERTGGRLGVWL